MAHLPELIRDLALILVAAGVVTLVFRYLRQPVVLGYILAGFLIGPHVAFTPTVIDTKGVQIWAEIGVIFLLFALGLEFSFKKLMKVGGAASMTAFFEVTGMTLLGYVVGRAFGWNQLDSIFLGGILAISSTTIIIRAFDELGMKRRGFAGLVFGILIVEDLFAILLLVLLSSVAVKHELSGTELAISTARLLAYVAAFVVAGLLLVPPLLYRLRNKMNDETLLVVSIGLCFLMVVLNTKAGFSPALGAFIMGSVLAESTDAKRIEHLIHPVKDLFAAIFFVSVGMMIDPKVILDHAGLILILTIATIVGKFLTTFLGAVISGRNLKHSVQAGMSLAQIGEFSFIIAGLGLSLKVTSEFLYPVAVGVSAITTFTTPYLIRSADSAYSLAVRTLPPGLLSALEAYSAFTQRAPRAVGPFGFIKSQLRFVFDLANAVKNKAIPPLAPWNAHIANTVVAPESEMAGRTLEELKVRERFGVTIAWITRGRRVIPAPGRQERLLPGDQIAFIGTDEQLEAFGDCLEQKERRAGPSQGGHYGLSSLLVKEGSSLAGVTIRDSGLRERTQGLVVGVEREGERILNPDSTYRLLPGDLLWIVGDREKISIL